MVKAWRSAEVLLWAMLATLIGTLLIGPYNSHEAPWQMTRGATLIELIGLVMAVRAAVHRGLDRRSRGAWAVIALAYFMISITEVLRGVFPPGQHFPNPADLMRLAVVPVLLTGLLSLPMRTRGRRARHKLWLDTAVVVLGSGMLLWYLEVGAAVAAAGHIPGRVLAAAIALPASDLVMIFGGTVVLLRGANGSTRRPAVLITLAMLMLVVGDAYLGYRQSHFGRATPDQWQLACWLTGFFLLTMAAFTQVRQAGGHPITVEDPIARKAARLPYVAMGLGYALLVMAVVGYQVRTVGLVLGAVAMTSVVVFRQIVVLRENYEMATTDTLTGLVNRRQLYDRLRLALARGARNGSPVGAVLIDMNGFKQVNDTMGHEAGDELLVAFGKVLKANVLGRDVVGRLGGDEFAVILHDIGSADNAVAVVRRILAAMAVPVMIGDVAVQPRASFGVALSQPGETDDSALLRRADVAMYRAKQAAITMYAVYDDGMASTATSG